jgi:hypothetical protein
MISGSWIASGLGILAAAAVFAAATRSVTTTTPVVAASEPALEEPFSESWLTATTPLISKNLELVPVFAAAIRPPRSREDSEPVKATVPVEVAVARSDVRQTVGTTASVRRHRNICARNAVKKRKVWISSKQWSCQK